RAPGDDRGAGDRAGRDRDRELAGGELARLVLAELEAQPAAVLRLDDVDAARVGAGDEAALLEDEIEEAIDVALLGERARDLDQLAQLVAVAADGAGAALGGDAQLDALEASVDRGVERVGRVDAVEG